MKKSKLYGRLAGQFLLFCSIVFIVSCNKEFNNTLPTEWPNDTLGMSDGKKKVLFIILDGVKGDVLESVKPKNLTAITKNSIYSYDGIADYQHNALSQANAWATLLSGVDYTGHQVVSDDFSGFDPQETPTIFKRLNEEYPDIHTTSFSSSTAFNDNLATDAKFSKAYNSDAEVVNATINELKTVTPSLLVAQLSGADIAAVGDYSVNNTNYVNALQEIDKQVGDIMSTLYAREQFAKENWLVIISSSKGGGVSGTAEGSNIYEDNSRNTFVAFYNPKFKANKYSKPDMDALPFAGTSPRFISKNQATYSTATQPNTTIGNFGVSGAYTLMLKVRDDNPSVQTYPMFFGKRNPANTDVGAKGWGFLMGGGNFQLDWGSSPRPSTEISTKDGKWHTVGFTIFQSGNSRKLSLFSDSKFRTTVDITNNNTDNDFPLRMGTDKNFNTNLIFRDVVILNVALTNEEIQKYMRQEFNANNPYFKNAIGFWPGTESSGTEMLDLSGHNNPFKLNAVQDFATYSEIAENISPNISQSAFTSVPNNVDVAVMIYNWLNISVPKEWGLMGKFYKPTINLPRD